VLAVTCGLRRGEICALRWRNVELAETVQLAVVGSTEQTKAGIREKETKSGRARTVALTALAVEELRRHKLRQAEELLRLGLRQSDDMYVVAQADGQPLKPNSLIYSHVLPGMQAEAASRVDQALRQALDKQRGGVKR